ncbi:MAG: ion transporter [Trueperaceae bacterium]
MTHDSLRRRVGHIIFETTTPAARTFDVVLLWVILLSVLAAVLESVSSLEARWGETLRGLEWGFTVAFTIEYLLRIYSAKDRRRYIFSYFGLVDLLAVLPTYLSLVVPGAQYALVLRSLRLLRVFRILKLAHFLDDADLLVRAMRASREKILVFLFAVMTIVLITGTAMYLIEGPANGFDNIPLSVYWAIVTVTTVGFGDLTPLTPVGRFLASMLMITGYAIIAVPTGIVTTELGLASRSRPNRGLACSRCGAGGHTDEANYCYSCGERLNRESVPKVRLQ